MAVFEFIEGRSVSSARIVEALAPLDYDWSMRGYWGKVLSEALDKTISPGWDWKKFVFVFLATWSFVAACFQFGLAAIPTAAADFVWVVVPGVAFAVIVLFLWGLIETQAELYSELEKTSNEQAADLQHGERIAAEHGERIAAEHRDIVPEQRDQPARQTTISKYISNKPNYPAVRLQREYRLGVASRLWCDLGATAPQIMESKARYEEFVSAIQLGQLKFRPRIMNDPSKIEHEKQNPDWRTTVTRAELKRYAASIGQDPLFLRDN
jgi:hypothetical protein